MANLFVPNNIQAGYAFEKSFLSVHPALGMRTTPGSGSVHGDGDGRARHVEHEAVQFALEGKVRQSEKKLGFKPTAAEWRKAMGDPRASTRDGQRGQLRKFTPRAVRLFAVYNCNSNEYWVWIPFKDTVQLMLQLGLAETDVAFNEHLAFGSKTPAGIVVQEAYGFSSSAWAELYHLIAKHHEDA